MTQVSKIIGIQEPLGHNKVLLYSGEDNEKGKKRIPDPTEAIVNNRRKEINTVDLCKAKRVKMKQLIPQDETSQGNLAQTPSDSSTKFHSNQVP